MALRHRELRPREDGLRAEGEIVKKDPHKQQVFGWAYITHSPNGELVIDKSGEFVDDVEELEKAAYSFVLSSRRGGTDHARDVAKDEVIHKSTMIESMVFTPDKIEALGIPAGTIPTGWWVGFQIHDSEAWDRVMKNELTSFSIHGKGTKKEIDS